MQTQEEGQQVSEEADVHMQTVLDNEALRYSSIGNLRPLTCHR